MDEQQTLPDWELLRDLQKFNTCFFSQPLQQVHQSKIDLSLQG